MTIKRLVCSGGGAKGVIYAGAYDALTETGVIKEIEEVAGASAGAITAALIALGMPVDKFRDVLMSTNLKSLLGKHVRGTLMAHDGEPLLALIRDNITTTVLDFLSAQDNGDLDRDVTALKAKLQKVPPDSFTFGDLTILQTRFPNLNRFKTLTVTATTYPDGELKIFNQALTPDVEIALACRASASIPVVLQETMIDQQRYVDAGLLDNIPTDYFDDPVDQVYGNQKKDETLVLAFGEGLDDKKNPVFQALIEGDLISDEFLKQVLNEAISSANTTKKTLISQINRRLNHYVKTSDIEEHEADSIKAAIKQLAPLPTVQDNVEDILSRIKAHLKPSLYHPDFFERFKRNTCVKWFSGFKGRYENTDRKEEGYQKLRKDYHKQTIELRVGNIKTTDFDEAEIIAQEMCAMGYLDTMRYQFSHGLRAIESGKFYDVLLTEFKTIYSATLAESARNSAEDALLGNIQHAQGSGKSAEYIVCQLIKPDAERNITSVSGFSLSRAVEQCRERLSENQLIAAKTTVFEPNGKRNRERSAMRFLAEIIDSQPLVIDDVLAKFERVYRSILSGSNQDPAKDRLLSQIAADKYGNKTTKEILNALIKSRAVMDLNSAAAFSLSRAIEWSNNTLSEPKLLIETHAKAKKQQTISRTNFKREQSAALIKTYKANLADVKPTPKKRHEIIVETLFKP